ncbi:Na+/H+ antiporter NhaA [Clostridium manihotivorum]|uniref:Na(+)/H(+) antiporter NhaA n=1 Tax=Clostridium manihotivorum TaxID=2320868 RepID=A0A410DRS4_9CLOT|nr:Na+/H+ antiporter NhaA [Clostridium manihotivorum]QAA31804.1 Na+/H+ antiporter NhaA [Clostridium manihotivorum]
MQNTLKDKNYNFFLNFFRSEASSGILLLACSIIAILAINSDFGPSYNEFLHKSLTIGYKEVSISMSIGHWINDGLMAIFFFVVGMEIKKEILIGELKSIKTTILPIAAAIAGMIVPSVIYAISNYNQPTIHGFGVPMATDIAFALGIISLAGKKAPKGIVVFLTALAIVDDLGAIIVIALFYSSELSWIYLLISAAIVCLLILANKLKVKAPAVFIMMGVILWFTVHKSGIHSTFAGVLLGMTIPGSRDEQEFEKSMLHRLETAISPWSSYLIMPLFALANAGVAISTNSISTIMATPVSIGIILGLFLGKQLGIFGISALLVKLKIAELPTGVNNKHLYGASILGGIGFTMSIFVSSLSFSDEAILSTAKMSIMVASLLSAIFGLLIFNLIKTEPEEASID